MKEKVEKIYSILGIIILILLLIIIVIILYIFDLKLNLSFFTFDKKECIKIRLKGTIFDDLVTCKRPPLFIKNHGK